MPTYNYKCADCKFDLDEFRLISRRDDPKDCPMCGSNMPYNFVPSARLQIKGLLYLGGAQTKSFREEKVAEAKQIMAEGKQKTNAEKAAVLAERFNGDKKFLERRQKQIERTSNDLVKFVDENKRNLTPAS